jgi:hypothetical protein
MSRRSGLLLSLTVAAAIAIGVDTAHAQTAGTCVFAGEP